MAPPAGPWLRADDCCAFELPVSGGAARTPEWWARATFEGMPNAPRRAVVAGWRLGLGLRLRPAPDRVLGWSIAASTADSVTLEATSALLAARNVVRVSPVAITWITTVDYRRPLGRLLWSVAAPVHHRTLPILLTRANRAVSR